MWRRLAVRAVRPLRAVVAAPLRLGLHRPLCTADRPQHALDQSRVAETRTGLQYVDVSQGSGPLPEQGDYVAIRYKGTFDSPSGDEFDSNLEHGEPLRYVHKGLQVVAGMDEAVAGMRPGGRRIAIIPPHLGYGAKEVGPIPPDSTLCFDITLEAVGDDAAPPPMTLGQRLKYFFFE